MTTNYILTNIPKEFWNKVKIAAIKQDKTIKQFILDALKEKIERNED